MRSHPGSRGKSKSKSRDQKKGFGFNFFRSLALLVRWPGLALLCLLCPRRCVLERLFALPVVVVVVLVVVLALEFLSYLFVFFPFAAICFLFTSRTGQSGKATTNDSDSDRAMVERDASHHHHLHHGLFYFFLGGFCPRTTSFARSNKKVTNLSFFFPSLSFFVCFCLPCELKKKTFVSTLVFQASKSPNTLDLSLSC